ncbi:MAG: hypothetical protein QM736_24760 [Vicinamibacterales bacterium]
MMSGRAAERTRMLTVSERRRRTSSSSSGRTAGRRWTSIYNAIDERFWCEPLEDD